MDSKYKKIQLSEILNILNVKEEENKPYLFINPSSSLDTFFSIKARLIDIYKLKQKLDEKPDLKNEIQKEIQSSMAAGMRNGDWLVYHLGKDPKFDLVTFLKQFQFYDKDMSKPENIKKKDFVLDHKIVIKENLVDIFGNRGIFDVRETFKFCFMSTCKINEIDQLLKVNNEFEFDVSIV